LVTPFMMSLILFVVVTSSSFCVSSFLVFFSFFYDTSPTVIYTLSLHDALPICPGLLQDAGRVLRGEHVAVGDDRQGHRLLHLPEDRKSTRLNSSHVSISYAVFCLKKKKKKDIKFKYRKNK